MTRHARNCTAGAVYSYHERKRDTDSSGYGSKELRFGKDSVREFDCCCLTLQPCANPVITPDGYIYDKQAIIENIIHQKKLIAKKMKEFEKQKQKTHKETDKAIEAEKKATFTAFLAKQSVGTSANDGAVAGPSTPSITSKDKALPSFWVPSLTPQATATKVKKPDEKVRCPMSDRPLRLKDLLDIKFTPIKDDGKKSLIAKDARYVCPVTNDVLGNSVPCVVLRTSGNVVTAECIEKIIKKDMIDPTNGKKLTDKDFLYLQRGSSGFSGSGVELKAKIDGPVMMA